MNIFNSLLGKKKTTANVYDQFWQWFRKNERLFHKVIRTQEDIEERFLNKLTPELEKVKEGLSCLAGMCDANTAELIITIEGDAENIAFAEELVNTAPALDGWKFTALKQPLDHEDLGIRLGNRTFSSANISFYSNDFPEYPDEIDITFVYHDKWEENDTELLSGMYMFIDNYLGEMDAVAVIDNFNIIGRVKAEKELIPLSKLKGYLKWRQAEFIEKYEGTRYVSENDQYSCIETKLKNGNMLVALVNTDLLAWDAKASHPWILRILIEYDGKTRNGMPDEQMSKSLNNVEDLIMADLKDSEGYLNIGRETGNNVREIYFACREFRKPSRTMKAIKDAHSDKTAVDYSIYKDKYWQSFERFIIPVTE